MDELEVRYKAQVVPELYPDQPQPRLENWHPEDLEAFCGGEYAVKAFYAHVPQRYTIGVSL